jgi:hypothetical protein
MIYIDNILATRHTDEIARVKKGLLSKRKLKELLFKRFLSYDIIRESLGVIVIN